MTEPSKDISNIIGVNKNTPVQSGDQQQKQSSTDFKSLMENNPQDTHNVSTQPNPFELAAKQSGSLPTHTPTHDTLIHQMNSTSSVLGDVQQQLNNKQLNLRQSQKYLLRNKLKNAQKHISVAAEKTGISSKKTQPTFSRQSPVSKFLGLLTDSQKQLSSAKTQLQKIGSDGKSLHPAEMLTIQIKMAKAQQELEYSSVLLSTATSDIKTLFNIQL